MKLANIAGGDCSYTVFKTTVQVTIFPLKLCFVVDFIVNCNNKKLYYCNYFPGVDES